MLVLSSCCLLVQVRVGSLSLVGIKEQERGGRFFPGSAFAGPPAMGNTDQLEGVQVQPAVMVAATTISTIFKLSMVSLKARPMVSVSQCQMLSMAMLLAVRGCREMVEV